MRPCALRLRYLLLLGVVNALAGPAVAAVPGDFEGARWIWYSREPMPASINFPAGTSFFRGSFKVPQPAAAKSATVSITADNLWSLHLNGKPAGAGEMDPNAWSRARSIDVTSLLTPGRNVLAVEAVNTIPGPAALIVSVSIQLDDGTSVRWHSDEDWKCSDREQSGWQQAGFDDEKWQAAHVVGDFGMAPWGKVKPVGKLQPAGPPDAATLRQFSKFKTNARFNARGIPTPPVELNAPPDYSWPEAVVFLGDDCSLYRPSKRAGTSQDSLSVTIFNPNHTRAYPEHDLPAPVKMGRRLLVLRPARPETQPRELCNAGRGAIGPPSVSYDGRWIYFPMAPEDSAFFHIYRIPAGGGKPEQLTDGPFHDIDPCELPDGRLVFSSTRIGVFEEYHNPPSRALFIRETDGSIHPLTHTIIFDNEPRMLADGRILFLRSDNFFDRGKVETRLHAIYPDGTAGQTEFGLDQGPEYGNRLRAFRAGSAAPLPDGRVAWVDGSRVNLARPGTPAGQWRKIGITAADLAAVPDSRLLCTVTSRKPVDPAARKPSSAWPFRRIALLDPDAPTPEVVTLHESPTGAVHSPAYLGPRPKPQQLFDRIDTRKTTHDAATGVFICQDVRQTHNSTAGWQHVRAIRVLAGRGLTYRSSHSYIVHAGSEVVDLGTVPLAPDGSFAVEVPADTAIAFQAVDAEGRSELNQMSWIYVRPGESRSCVGCHQPRQSAPPPVPGTLQALRSPPLKLTGRGDPLRFRGNNPAVTGLMELQFDRFREIAGINRHAGAADPDATGRDEIATLISDLGSNAPTRQHAAAGRAAVFRDPACAPALANCLDSHDREVRVAAAIALAACGTTDSIDALTKAMTGGDPVVGQAAALALENLLGTPVPGFDPFAPRESRLQALASWQSSQETPAGSAWREQRVAELNSGNHDRARRAAVALAHCGGPPAAPALRKVLLEQRNHNPFPAWRADHKHRGDGTRFNSLAAVNPRCLQEVTRALGAAGSDDSVPTLAETAAANLAPNTGNLFLAEAAVEALGNIASPAAEAALLTLIPQLPPYQQHCAWYGDHSALIACHAAPVHALIVEALDSIGSRGAGPHAASLIRMVPTDPDRALFPANDDFETLVGRVIRRSGRADAVATACLHLLGDTEAGTPDPELITAIGDVHGAWAGTPCPEIRAAQVLSLALRDPIAEPRVRNAFLRYASSETDIPRVFDTGIPVVTKLPVRNWVCFYLARTLGQLRQAASIPTLIAALDAHPPEAATGRPDPLGPGVLFLHNDLTPCWRAAAAWALGSIGDPAATPPLLRVLENLDNATDTRHAAATALARTARSNDLPRLRKLATTIPEVSVRRAITRASKQAALSP